MRDRRVVDVPGKHPAFQSHYAEHRYMRSYARSLTLLASYADVYVVDLDELICRRRLAMPTIDHVECHFLP